MNLVRGAAKRNPKILTLGDLNVDLNVRVPQLPMRGGNALAQFLEMTAGGTSGNFAVAISRLGVFCGIITQIGSDQFGTFLLDDLQKEGVDISHIEIVKSHTSNKVIIIIDEDNIITSIASLGSASKAPLHFDKEYLLRSKLLGVSGVSLLIPSMKDAALRAIEIAQQNDILVSFDPNLRVVEDEMSKSIRLDFQKAIRLTDIFLPNEEEIKHLTNTTELSEAGRIALSWGPKIIAIKRGSLGCRIITESLEVDYPAFPVNVLDVLGAGDAFDAAFVVGYLQGWNVDRIAYFANAEGALCITSIGARSSLPYKHEVETFLQEHNLKYTKKRPVNVLSRRQRIL